ncbi:ADP-ribosylglycohydrolase [Cryobacterium psychrotolerans]|uniref:ADP-ribosylglycohydrolase n=1 Tax=Cryobacterium psychrotolerans TaxID=386301 RepID=A0A1G8XCZ1_9MICO|nr:MULTISPECIES: ADP-ribosylglycohydrolase family protein [Cryobacterium]TFD45751.1 ADP-ribosylglycohydrolase family protein [Cryobacterium sp. TMT1-2-1]TFD82966.1 ADP-ribosylglycohydrolase family protein [Cryobacterium psychrotolerans]SDJ87795.1 ADP-ribosylglycohydrolase [Cryobacterium psychrotolerans]
MNLTSAQHDRAAGTLLGLACGDALGAGYDCLEPMPDAAFVTMGGMASLGLDPGEWSDDTATAIDVVGAAAAAEDLRNEGVQRGLVPQSGAAVHKHSEQRSGRVDNSSLLRSAGVALAYLDDPVALAEAARAISALTHDQTDAQDACVLWALAVHHAVLHGELNVRVGLTALPRERQTPWWRRLDDADRLPPSAFDRNNGVVEALQGAWSSLVHLDVIAEIGQTDADFLRQSIENSVRAGRGATHVAAITGALAGARWGASAVPAEWRRILHGRPGLRAPDLVRLAVLAARKGAPDAHGWPSDQRIEYERYGGTAALVRHPHDSGVWLGGVGALDRLPAQVDAVVSLCRVGTAQVPARIRDHIAVWLVDDPRPEMNPNLDFVLVDTVDEIAALRAEGHIVFVHCVQAISRTPAVAALYASRHCRIPLEQALADIIEVLPAAKPNPALRDALAPRLMRVEH